MRINGAVDAAMLSAAIVPLAISGRGDDPDSSGPQVWPVDGHTEKRKGFDGLALLAQEALKREPPRSPVRRPGRSTAPRA
jgi:hypothetical protein